MYYIRFNLRFLFSGTWNGIKIKTAARNRTRTAMPWVLVEFLWRRKHHGDLWGGLLNALKGVAFSNTASNPPAYTEDIVPDEEINDSTDDEEGIVPEVDRVESSEEEFDDNTEDEDYQHL